jgi:urocanate hydratase
MVIDGSDDSKRRLESMLFWDVNNGVARRAWAGNKGAEAAIDRSMEVNPLLKITRGVHSDASVVSKAIDTAFTD